MDGGQVLLDGNPLDIFATRQEELHKAGVGVPPVTEVLQYLKGRRLPLQDRVRTVNEAVASIYDSLRGNDHAH